MDVFLKDGRSSANLGPRDGLTSFFDTVACRLEPAGRGTRFPVVSTRLRLGRVTRSEAARAIEELSAIAPELRKLPAANILWVGQQPIAAYRSTNAADRLTAPDGKPLLDHLLAGAQQTLHTGEVLRLNCPAQNRRELLGLLGVSVAGIAWALFAHALFPHWVLAPASQSDSDPSGIPLWTFGILAPACAIPTLVGLAVPAVKVWSAMHTWGAVTWYLVVVTLWLIFAFMQN
jgi:hypothetical protein